MRKAFMAALVILLAAAVAVSILMGEKKQLTNENAALQKQISALETALADDQAREEALKDAQAELAALREACAQQDALLAESTDERARLQAELEETKAQLIILRAETGAQ